MDLGEHIITEVQACCPRTLRLAGVWRCACLNRRCTPAGIHAEQACLACRSPSIHSAVRGCCNAAWHACTGWLPNPAQTRTGCTTSGWGRSASSSGKAHPPAALLRQPSLRRGPHLLARWRPQMPAPARGCSRTPTSPRGGLRQRRRRWSFHERRPPAATTRVAAPRAAVPMTAAARPSLSVRREPRERAAVPAAAARDRRPRGALRWTRAAGPTLPSSPRRASRRSRVGACAPARARVSTEALAPVTATAAAHTSRNRRRLGMRRPAAARARVKRMKLVAPPPAGAPPPGRRAPARTAVQTRSRSGGGSSTTSGRPRVLSHGAVAATAAFQGLAAAAGHLLAVGRVLRGRQRWLQRRTTRW